MDRFERERNKNKKVAPTEQVVALKYDKGAGAPKVIAKGSGYVAEKILEIAEEKNIPVHTDKKLVSTLDKLELGDAIPDELFAVVAQIYAFVDRIDAVVGAHAKNEK